MRAVRISVTPFEFISYLEFQCTKELNRHGTLKITGLIKQEKSRKYIDMASRETWVSVYAISENENIRRFFAGVLTGLWIKKEGRTHTLTIEIKTGSFLLDIGQHIRSFQNAGFYYSEVANACMKPESGKLIVQDGKDKTVDKFLLQYKETDWEFMKRLASYAGVALIADDSIPEKRIFWGCRDMTATGELHSDSYYIEQDYEKYEKRMAAGDMKLQPSDMFRFVVCSREIYGLGEIIRFEGKELIVGKIESWLEGQELYNRYYLITKVGSLPISFYNNRLSGIPLKATVSAAERTVVKIKIKGDENKEACGNRWFDYATVYSTPDGTGWYCMPEIGDGVRIVFPDCDENHAYVSSSVHLGTNGGRTNPEEKSWKNRQNKEIRFTSEAIILSNNNGMSVELWDKEGIKIISNRDIMVQSDGDIQIRSQSGGVNMSAGGSILMQQGAAKVQLCDAINICGGKIYMN